MNAGHVVVLADVFGTGCVTIAVRGERDRPRAVRARAFNSVSLSPAIVARVSRAEDSRVLDTGHACGISVLAQDTEGAPPMHWQPARSWGCRWPWMRWPPSRPL